MTVVIIADDVRLRAGPGAQYAIITELAAGAVCEPTSAYGWREVVTPEGQLGWVAVTYLRETADEEGEP